MRSVLDRAAVRMGVDVPTCSLPDDEAVAAVIAHGGRGTGGRARAGFGGEQLLLQNRGLFDLLEARAEARGDA